MGECGPPEASNGTVRIATSSIRAPKVRATRRRIAPIGDRFDVRELPDFTFAELDKQALLLPLLLAEAGCEHRAIERLEDLARSYLGWKEQPANAKGEVRYSLHVVAEEACRAAMDIDAARTALAALPDDAKGRLWAELMSARDWPSATYFEDWLFGEEVDWCLVARAAKQAVSRLRGGDVPNRDLAAALGGLVDIFESATGTPASMSRAIARPRAADFAVAFFRYVDPGFRETTILNSLEKLLVARRRTRRAQRRS